MQDKNSYSFVLYTEYMEQIEILSREQRGDLLTAIMLYASGEPLNELDGMTKMAFSFIKSRMDRDKAKYEETVRKRREAGKLGGRPTEKANGSSEKQEKAKKANGFSEKQSEAKKPDNDTVNVYVNDIKKKDPKGSKEKAPRFSPPTRLELAAYCTEKSLRIDVDRFLDYYESNGWMVGKNKMKDWKASARNWSRREDCAAEGKGMIERDYDMDSLERELLRS